MSEAAPIVISDSRPSSGGTSGLGGPKAIAERYQAHLAGQDTSLRAEAKVTQEVKAEPKEVAKEIVKEAPKEIKRESSILPQEKEIKTAEPKEEKKAQSTESTPIKKVGVDGLTKEERSELVAFKEKASRVDELEQKVKDHESTSKERDELKALTKELESKVKLYEAKATALDVTTSPHFQKTITEPIVRISKSLESIIKGNSLDADAIWSAIQNPKTTEGNAILSEQMAALDTLTSRQFERMVNDLRDLDAKGQDLIAKAPEAWTAIQEDERKRSVEQSTKDKEVYTRANQAVYQAMEERFPFFKEGDIGKEILKDASEADFKSMSPDKLAYYAQAGMAMLHVNSVIKAKDAEIASLKSALKKEKSPGPADGDHSTSTDRTNGDSSIDLSKLTPGQRFQLFKAGKIS